MCPSPQQHAPNSHPNLHTVSQNLKNVLTCGDQYSSADLWQRCAQKNAVLHKEVDLNPSLVTKLVSFALSALNLAHFAHGAEHAPQAVDLTPRQLILLTDADDGFVWQH